MEASKILIIGSHEMRASVSACLSERFIKLEERNEIYGWRTVLREGPDLIILDAAIPGMDDVFCRLLKTDQRTRHIPVMLLSNRLLVETDADVSLSWPLTENMLELCIHNIFRLRKTFSYRSAGKVPAFATSLRLNTGRPDFMERMVTAIEENMHLSPFGISEVCKVVGVSRSALYKKFSMYGGMTIGELMKSLRLKRAASLLASRQWNVSEVAWAVGFNDRKYFSREFRKVFGQSPTAFMISQETLCDSSHCG